MREFDLFFYGFISSAVLSFLVGWLFHQNILQQLKKNEQELDTLKDKLAASEDERLDLMDKHELVQEILDTSPSFVYVKNVKGQMMLANLKYFSMVGSNKENVIGKTDFEIFPALVAKNIRDNDAKVLATGRTIYFEEVIPSLHDKRERVFFSVKFPLRNRHGNIYAVGGISTDITEKKETEERLNLAMRATGMGTIFWDVLSDHHEWSEQTKNLFGVSPDENFGFEDMMDLIHPDERNQVRRVMKAKMVTGEDFSTEYRVRQPDGDYRWLAVRAKPILDSSRNPIQLLGVCWDISEFKETVYTLKETLHAKEEFLKVISHEIKTPLSSLMLKIQMARRNLDKGDSSILEQERLVRYLGATEVEIDRLVKSAEKIVG